MNGNTISIVGEVVASGNGRFTIACDYKLKTGEVQTDYFDVLGKATIGRQVHVLGRLTYETTEEAGDRAEKALIKPQNVEIVGKATSIIGDNH